MKRTKRTKQARQARQVGRIARRSVAPLLLTLLLVGTSAGLLLSCHSSPTTELPEPPQPPTPIVEGEEGPQIITINSLVVLPPTQGAELPLAIGYEEFN